MLAGIYLILDLEEPTFLSVLLILFSVAISIFYLVVLITLIKYVEYFEARLGRMQDRLIQLENGKSPSSRLTADSSSPTRSRGKLGDRIGKL